MSIIYILFGLSIGVLSGFFGIGGGFILTPTLLLLGFPPIIAISTSLMYSIGTSASGVFAHFRLKNIQWKIAIIIGSSGIVATQVAQPFVLWLESKGIVETIIPSAYIVILAYFAYSLLKKEKKKDVVQAGQESILKAIVIGFIGGFLSTTLGVGGGFVMVPLMITLLGLPSKKAVGTSLVSVFFIVITGFISYAFVVDIPYQLGFYLIVGGLIGGQIGAKLTLIYQNNQIKLYFGILYIVTLASAAFELLELSTLGLSILGAYLVFLFSVFTKDSLILFRKKRELAKKAS
jgi:uncharacterized protein